MQTYDEHAENSDFELELAKCEANLRLVKSKPVVQFGLVRHRSYVKSSDTIEHIGLGSGPR
jgi:hypothetical protein